MYQNQAWDWSKNAFSDKPDEDYTYHVAHYGHPSKFGYKDIIPLWKAERWDPEKLMALYKKVGAKYFVSMGTHHDNFFLWNSKLHKWNSVNMGPKKDVVGLWQKLLKKKVCVSEFLNTLVPATPGSRPPWRRQNRTYGWSALRRE